MATHTWDITITPAVDQDLDSSLGIRQRCWIVKHKGESTQTDALSDFYELRSWEDGAVSLTIGKDGVLGLIHSFNTAYTNDYAVVEYVDDAMQYTVEKNFLG